METAGASKMLVNFYHITWHRTLKTVIFIAVSMKISDLAELPCFGFCFCCNKGTESKFWKRL